MGEGPGVTGQAEGEPNGSSRTPTVELPLDAIVVSDYIRAAGVDEDHVRTLADCDDELPPVLLQRDTLRVIDGVHRIRAAELRGDRRIRARLLDVNDQAAFVESV